MKIRIYLLAIVLLFAGVNTASASSKIENKQQAQVRLTEIKDRVNEIRSMDMSQLNTEERTALKTELKGTKTELKQLEPYLYISAGALLLIILILILIL